jgi:hypothetical protein
VHQVRAWWNANNETEGEVKRAAREAVRSDGRVLDLIEFESMDMSTYNTPQLNAMIRFRVLSPAEKDRRAELKTRRYKTCEGCGSKDPGQLVRMHADGAERALCFGCWSPLKGSCRVLHWIDRNGALEI